MNRRDFLINASLALGGFTILPAAKTYERIWRPDPTLHKPWQTYSNNCYSGFAEGEVWIFMSEKGTGKSVLQARYRNLILNKGKQTVDTGWKCQLDQGQEHFIINNPTVVGQIGA